jgi:hypothetical protein
VLKLSKLVAVLLVIIVGLAGCQSTSPNSTSQPNNNEVAGSYTHQPSGMMFPQTLADFQRADIKFYDKEGLDMSVGYNIYLPPRMVVATFYVFPAPRLVSIGSPPNVVDTAKEIAVKSQFESTKQAILEAHPGAKLIDEKDTSILQAGGYQSGKMATFEYEDLFAQKRQLVQSMLYLFCYAGSNWSIEYRFSYPKSFDASKDIEDFMRSLSWTLTNS